MGQQDILSTLQKLIASIDENIVIFDQDGTVRHASEGLKKLVHDVDLVDKSIFNYISGTADGVKQFLSRLSESHFKDIKINMLCKGVSFPARLRMVAWSLPEDRFVVMASVVDGTFIERRKRDLLRKTLTIEQLSKSRKIRTGKLNEAIYEILELSSKAVKVKRVNAWLFDEDATQIECIGNFDAAIQGFVQQESLPRIDMPKYFELFETEKIILSTNSQQSDITKELKNSYLIPNNIHAMMDIPIRIEGDIIGVICFEEVGQTREWSLQDQKFGLIAAQMVSLAVETYRRKLAQQQLERAYHFQQQLIAETHHRVKNNIGITAGILRLQLDKCKDEYHKNLIQDAVNRLHSIAALHELLMNSPFNLRVPFESYCKELIKGIEASYQRLDFPIQLVANIDDCEMSSSLAINLGLIINEALTNAFKHAFTSNQVGMIHVKLALSGVFGILTIADTGTGYSKIDGANGHGWDIIAGLVMHIDGKLTTTNDAGTTIRIQFRMQ